VQEKSEVKIRIPAGIEEGVQLRVAAEGDAGETEAIAAGTELWKRRAVLDADWPLSSRAINQRFADLRDVLQRIHDVESRAIAALRTVRDRIA
jgi:hypothetical protein